MLYGAIMLNSRVSGVYGRIYAVHTFVDRKIRIKMCTVLSLTLL